MTDLTAEHGGGLQLLVAGVTLEAPLVVPLAPSWESLSIKYLLLTLRTDVLLQSSCSHPVLLHTGDRSRITSQGDLRAPVSPQELRILAGPPGQDFL